VNWNGRWGGRGALRRLLRAGEGRTELVLELARDATWSARAGAADVEVRCTSGLALVTIEGDPEDHVLCAGATFVSGRRGRLAVWALEPARLRVTAGTSRAEEALERVEGQTRIARERGAALGMGSTGARR
jgi:hypothetical protein